MVAIILLLLFVQVAGEPAGCFTKRALPGCQPLMRVVPDPSARAQPKLRCAMNSKYMLDFKNSTRKECGISHEKFYIDYM